MNKPPLISDLEHRARRERFDLFLALASSAATPSGAIRILDVGGTWEYWSQFDCGRLANVEIVLLNVFPQHSVPPPFKAIVGDGRDLSRFRDREFDIVYSNSVLSLVGAFADQGLMAGEIRRVGKRYFVQTPNRLFVVDWRTLVPFFHLLPVRMQAWCFRHFRVGLYPRLPDHAAALHHATRIRDLTARELQSLFPGATLLRERVLGLTKSFIVHSGFLPLRAGSASSTVDIAQGPERLTRTEVATTRDGC